MARELKYSSHNIDVTALQRELTGGPVHQPPPVVPDKDEEEDLYASLASRYDVGEDDDDADSLIPRRTQAR
ncbi:hypothetical protein J2S58_002823 [Nakamurella flavida]|nr:hypothetical protein [Nakamurella flavida]